MLVVIGDLVADLIVLGGAVLERGTDNPAEIRLTRGGSAANVAVAAASRHPVRFIGRRDHARARGGAAALSGAGPHESARAGGALAMSALRRPGAL